MKKIWAIRKDAEGVSPVIATILMVAITVVLAAVLYVMVLGFGGGTNTPSIQFTSKVAITSPDGYKWTMTGPTSEVSWTDLTIILQQGANSGTWATASQTSLTGSGVQTQELGAQTVATAFYVNVTDMGGNGYINNGDYFTITGTFVSGTSYTVSLMHEPTDGQMVAQTWTA
jgi:flagellin-like protein